ncbi:MAG: hypothetical protein WCG50_16155 [Rhodoferax sp.]|uniref:hypothetical protein n=1 Tax=Rhodoferax sp. TaxID=50421 RepID=UPI003017C101
MPSVFWEDRDRKSLPFVNFMGIVLQDQIQNGWSDPDMASELGIDPKTYREWRSSISTPAILEKLVEAIDARYLNVKLPVNMEKLRFQLEAQRQPINRTVIPAQRSHVGMPTVEAFNRALEYCLRSVLKRWAVQSHPNNALTVAQAVADGLKWAYAYDPIRNIATWRELLIQKGKELASVSAELALMKEMTYPDFLLVSDVLVSQRQKDIEAKLNTILATAKSIAEQYLTAIEMVAIDEDQWSEKSAALYPFLPGPPADPIAKAAKLKRIYLIFNLFALISR